MTLGRVFLIRNFPLAFFEPCLLPLSMNKDVDSFGIRAKLSTEILI